MCIHIQISYEEHAKQRPKKMLWVVCIIYLSTRLSGSLHGNKGYLAYNSGCGENRQAYKNQAKRTITWRSASRDNNLISTGQLKQKLLYRDVCEPELES